MEPRFKNQGLKALAVCTLFLNLCLPLSFAEDVREEQSFHPVNPDAPAPLEMIAERMKALSGSLAAIPELPQLNQVIQIPDGFGPAGGSGNTDNHKETDP